MVNQRASGGWRDFYHEEELFRDHPQPVMIQDVSQGPALRHRHDFTELVLIRAGSARHETAAGVSLLSPGDFFVVEGEQFHAYLNPHDLRLINVIIRFSEMERLRPKLRTLTGYRLLFSESPAVFLQPRRLLTQELAEMERMCWRIREEAGGGREGRDLLLEALLTQLLVAVCRMAAPQVQRPAGEEEMRRVTRFLEENFGRKIYLQELEKIACASGRSLQRHFLEAHGMTPMQYLLRVRLTHAARILRETGDKCASIAEHCGFHDHAYFLRQFKSATGITPGEYRRRVEAVNPE